MKHNRLLSLTLAFLMMFSMAIIPVSAEDEIQFTESDLHEMTSYADAVEAGHVNRLTDEEAPNTIVFANADNTKTMYYYSEDIKYTDENGNVQDKTNKLTYLNGAYVNEDNDINVALPASLADGVTLTYADFEITMTPGFTGSSSLSTSPTAALLSSTQRGQADTVTYNSAFGSNISIRYTPMYSGLKEDIILSSYTNVYSFSFLVETGELLLLPDTTLNSDDDSMFEGNMSESPAPIRWYFAYSDDPTTPVAWFSDVYIYDSAGATATGSISAELLDEGSYELTVTADRAFLESSSTVYPVTIDPTVTINDSKIHDATISTYFGTTNYGSTEYLYIGGSHGYYSAIKFLGLQSNSVFSSLSADQIYSAKLSMYCYERSTTTPTLIISQYLPTAASSGYWLEDNITYSKCGISYDSTNQVSKTLTSTVQYSFDITNIVKAWKGSSALIEKGLLLRAASSSTYAYFASSEYSRTDLRPYLTINYSFNGIYQIRNVATTNLMNVATSSASNNADVYQYEEDYTAGQAFRIVYNSSSDTHKIYSVCSEFGYGYVIRQQSGDKDDIASGTYTSATGDWEFILSDDGSYNIKLIDTDYYISVSGSEDKSDIYLNTSATTDNERWTFEFIDDDGCVELSGLELHTQETGDTCSSACIKMVLGYYGVNKTESEILNYQNNNCGENDYTFAWVVRDTINHFLASNMYKSPSWKSSECKYYQIFMSLKNGNPAIINIKLNTGTYPYTCGSNGHYIVISGIINTSNGLYFKVYDPYLLYNNPSKTYNETIPEDNILLVSVDTLFGCMKSDNNVVICSESNYKE